MTCPSTMPLVTAGPFPWQCIPVWNRACAAEEKAQPGSCVVRAFGPATWWTPLHLTVVALAVLCAGAVLGTVIALIRDNLRNGRYERSRGGRS